MKRLTLLAILLTVMACSSINKKKIDIYSPDNKTSVTETTETKDLSIKKEDAKTFIDTIKEGFATIKDFIIFWDSREDEVE